MSVKNLSIVKFIKKFQIFLKCIFFYKNKTSMSGSITRTENKEFAIIVMWYHFAIVVL